MDESIVSASTIEPIFDLEDMRFVKGLCKIKIQSPGREMCGSGFLCAFRLGSIGHVMGMFTNHHVLDDEKNYVMEREDCRYEITDDQVESFWTNKDMDVTFVTFKKEFAQQLRGEDEWHFFKVADDMIVVGSSVTILQHPKGGDACVSRGEVTLCSNDTLHYTASTLRGSSGSPLLDDKYRVIGIHKMGAYFCNNQETGPYNIGLPIKCAINSIEGLLDHSSSTIESISNQKDKQYVKGLCKIEIQASGKRTRGSGFLCEFQLGSEAYAEGMLTNHSVLDSEKNYFMSIEKSRYTITNNQVERIWTNKDIDVTFVIFKKEFVQQLHKDGWHFFKVSDDEIALDSTVYILQHPELRDASVSSGKVMRCSNEILEYESSTFFGSSGSPLLDDNYRVFGIHAKGKYFPGDKINGEYNIGILLKCAINSFKSSLEEGGNSADAGSPMDEAIISDSPLKYISKGEDKQASKGLCKIVVNSDGRVKNASGFLCEFQLESLGHVMGMFTNNHVLDEKKNFFMTRENHFYEITKDQVKRFWTNKDIDVTFVTFEQNFEQQLHDDGWRVFKVADDKIDGPLSVTILQYPAARDACVSVGKVTRCLNDTLDYTASTLSGWSGSLLLDKNYRVFGIHNVAAFLTNQEIESCYTGTPIQWAIDSIKGLGCSSSDNLAPKINESYSVRDMSPVSMVFGKKYSVDWNTIESLLDNRSEWTKMVEDEKCNAELRFPPIRISLNHGSSTILELCLKRVGAKKIGVYGRYQGDKDDETLPLNLYMALFLSSEEPQKPTCFIQETVEMARKGDESWNKLFKFRHIKWGKLSPTTAPRAELTFQET